MCYCMSFMVKREWIWENVLKISLLKVIPFYKLSWIIKFLLQHAASPLLQILFLIFFNTCQIFMININLWFSLWEEIFLNEHDMWWDLKYQSLVSRFWKDIDCFGHHLYWYIELWTHMLIAYLQISIQYSSCPDAEWEGKWANGTRKPVKPKKYKFENMSSDSFFAFVVFHLVKYNRLWSTISESNQLNAIIKFLKLYVWLYGHFINDESALKSGRWNILYFCFISNPFSHFFIHTSLLMERVLILSQ